MIVSMVPPCRSVFSSARLGEAGRAGEEGPPLLPIDDENHDSCGKADQARRKTGSRLAGWR